MDRSYLSYYTNPLSIASRRTSPKSRSLEGKGVIKEDTTNTTNIKGIIQREITDKTSTSTSIKDVKSFKKTDGVYFTYGIEWDASTTNFMENSLKDRFVVVKNPEDKYQITSEKTTIDYIPPCEKGKKRCDKCKYTVEAQLGVFQENNSFDMTEMSRSFDSFTEFWNKVVEDKSISTQTKKIPINQMGYLNSFSIEDREKVKQGLLSQGPSYYRDVGMFSNCSMTENGVFDTKYGKGFYHYFDTFDPEGRPQITVGVELSKILDVYKTYYEETDIYQKIFTFINSVNQDFLPDKMVAYIKTIDGYNLPEVTIRQAIALLQTKRGEYSNDTMAFLFLLYYYAYLYMHHFSNGSPYIKAKFSIKLRTNPAALYRDLSPLLKAEILVFTYFLSELYAWEANLTLEYVQYVQSFDPNGKIAFPPHLRDFAVDRIVFKKLKQIFRPRTTYLIRSFNTSSDLPEGVQNRTLFGISSFDNPEYKKEYSKYFDTSELNVKKVPFVNYSYIETENIDDYDDNYENEPFLYIAAIKGGNPELQLHNERMDMWEWDSESYGDVYVVHLEFRSFSALYGISINLSNGIIKDIENINNLHDIQQLKYMTRAIVYFFFRPLLQIGYNKYPYTFEYINNLYYRTRFSEILVQMYPKTSICAQESVESLYDVLRKNCETNNEEMCNQVITKLVESIPYNFDNLQYIADMVYRIGLVKYAMTLLLGENVDKDNINFYDYSESFIKGFDEIQNRYRLSFQKMLINLKKIGDFIRNNPEFGYIIDYLKRDQFDVVLDYMINMINNKQ